MHRLQRINVTMHPGAHLDGVEMMGDTSFRKGMD
jgi:hypothetical protein